MSDSEPRCFCGEAGHYHCSELREKLKEMRSVIKVILEADCLKSHAFERGDDDCSVYELCKSALKWPGEGDNRCEHQYLPDEDGTVYTCGTSDGLILTEFGWLCEVHR